MHAFCDKIRMGEGRLYAACICFEIYPPKIFFMPSTTPCMAMPAQIYDLLLRQHLLLQQNLFLPSILCGRSSLKTRRSFGIPVKILSNVLHQLLKLTSGARNRPDKSDKTIFLLELSPFDADLALHLLCLGSYPMSHARSSAR